MKSPITTHVLDTAQGKPAAGISTTLEFLESGSWKEIGRGMTNADGRIDDLLPENYDISKGVYRLTLQTAPYFQKTNMKNFYPYVSIAFEIQETSGHYHVPLLLSPFGYSTYRGS